MNNTFLPMYVIGPRSLTLISQLLSPALKIIVVDTAYLHHSSINTFTHAAAVRVAISSPLNRALRMS